MPLLVDIFNADAFSLTTLTAAINSLPYVPGRLGELGLFEEEGVSSTNVSIEFDGTTVELVDIQPRNAPGKVVLAEKRKALPFSIPHLPESATIMADEAQGVREFGSNSSERAIESIRNKRLQKMRANIDLTLEAHRMQAIKGNTYATDGSLIDLYSTFGVSQITIDFDLDTATTDIREKCLDVLESIEAELQGLSFKTVRVLCGASFWRKLIKHKAIKDTYLNTMSAAELRGDPRDSFEFGGLIFERYRGTSTVKVADTEARIVPMGVAGLFITRFAPANYMETVNTIGLPYYAKAEPMSMNKGVSLEAQSNPVMICTRPRAVLKATE